MSRSGIESNIYIRLERIGKKVRLREESEKKIENEIRNVDLLNFVDLSATLSILQSKFLFAQTCRIESTALESRNFANSPSLPPPPLVGLPPVLLGTRAVTKVSSSSSSSSSKLARWYMAMYVDGWID